jgi:hypothetical protein
VGSDRLCVKRPMQGERSWWLPSCPIPRSARARFDLKKGGSRVDPGQQAGGGELRGGVCQNVKDGQLVEHWTSMDLAALRVQMRLREVRWLRLTQGHRYWRRSNREPFAAGIKGSCYFQHLWRNPSELRATEPLSGQPEFETVGGPRWTRTPLPYRTRATQEFESLLGRPACIGAASNMWGPPGSSTAIFRNDDAKLAPGQGLEP